MEPYVEVLHLREDPQVPGGMCVDEAALPGHGLVGVGEWAPGWPVCIGSVRSRAAPGWGQQGCRAGRPARYSPDKLRVSCGEGGRQVNHGQGVCRHLAGTRCAHWKMPAADTVWPVASLGTKELALVM